MPVVSTHDLTFHRDTVTKTYRAWARGEPKREWVALRLLQQHAPGLAPAPVSAELQADPPSIVMTRLPGTSLADSAVTGGSVTGGPVRGDPVTDRSVTGGSVTTGRLTADQTEAMADALHRLHTAISATDLRDQPLRNWHLAEAVANLRAWLTEAHELGEDPQTAAAFDCASRWLQSGDPDRLAAADVPPVFTQGDGNLSNFIWNDGEVHLVDFEDSGRSDRAFELADSVEHISMWVNNTVDTDQLTDALPLDEAERVRFDVSRRLWGTFWLLMLLPSGPAHARNLAGTLDRQVQRVLRLL